MNTTSTHPSPAASSTTGTVYECSECGEQTLQRRCEDCNLFTRRLGAGGHCPHCDELLLVTDLDLPPARSTTESYTDNLTSSPLRAQCTTAAKGRSLKLAPHDALQRQHRQRAKHPGWQQTYRQHRPMLERSIAWLVAGGNRKVRYRGVTKNNAWLHHRTAALNLRRLLNLGLVRHHGAWALT